MATVWTGEDPKTKRAKNPLSVLNRRHFSCSFPSGTSSGCLYLTVVLKFLIVVQCANSN